MAPFFLSLVKTGVWFDHDDRPHPYAGSEQQHTTEIPGAVQEHITASTPCSPTLVPSSDSSSEESESSESECSEESESGDDSDEETLVPSEDVEYSDEEDAVLFS